MVWLFQEQDNLPPHSFVGCPLYLYIAGRGGGGGVGGPSTALATPTALSPEQLRASAALPETQRLLKFKRPPPAVPSKHGPVPSDAETQIALERYLAVRSHAMVGMRALALRLHLYTLGSSGKTGL